MAAQFSNDSNDCGASEGTEGTSQRATTGADFVALDDRRQTCLLSHLVNMDGNIAERSELVDAVLSAETKNLDKKDQPTKYTIKIDLHHNQLPRLEDAGIIQYDWRQGTVRYDGTPSVEDQFEGVSSRQT